jgi:hypothetical protein
MKNKLFALLPLAFGLALNTQATPGPALGTAFTYQGLLNTGGSPANGSYDLTFQLFTSASNGTAVGTTQTGLP